MKLARLLRCITFLLLWCLLLSCCCMAAENSGLLLTYDSAYAEAFLAEHPDTARWSLPDGGPSRNPYADLDRGSLWACMDVQAQPALAHGIGSRFLPQALCTVVFAVDRTQTTFRPHSWEELRQSPVCVGMLDKDFMKRLILAAASYGLEGADGTNASALSLLEALHKQNLLQMNCDNQPITICLDSQAVQWRRQGRDLEILVPQDGTLVYTLGLLSKDDAAGLPRQVLLDAGFRLPDGSCTDPAYPPASRYDAAAPVRDFSHFSSLTDSATSRIRRTALHTRLYSSADGKESVLFFTAAIMLILFWTAYALHRSPRSDIRNWVRLVSFLCIGWILLSAFKYQLPISTLNRMCWYAYYIFLPGLPLALLSMAAVVDRPFRQNKMPRWLLPFIAVYGLLLILVLTNDLHQLVFRFDPNGNWGEQYRYGPGYFAVFLFCYLTFLLALGLLIHKGRKSPKRFAVWQPLLTGGLLLLYNAGYVLQIPLARDSNLSLIFCILAILFAESILHSGLVPTNTHYRDLFDLAGLQLLDQDGTVVLSSPQVPVLTPSQLRRIRLTAEGADPIDERTLLHHQAIPGGTALWFEDVSSLYETRQQLEASIRSIESANTLLRNEETVQRREIAAQFNAQLFRMLEEDIAEKTAVLARTVRALPTCAEPEQQLSYLALLLCHIKRRCNLFFLAQQGSLIPSSELSVYLDELCEFALCSQVQVLFHCSVTGSLSVQAATICYDFFFSLLSWAVQQSGATLIARLDPRGEALIFSVLSSEAVSENLFPAQLREDLVRSHAALTLHPQDDLFSIVLTLPGKEAPHGQPVSAP